MNEDYVNVLLRKRIVLSISLFFFHVFGSHVTEQLSQKDTGSRTSDVILILNR